MNDSKIVAIICMHGRHETVRRCNELMPFIDKYYVYSTQEDKEFLESINTSGTLEVPNQPLTEKWNAGIKMLRSIEFDGAMILGSDDYIDLNLFNFIKSNIELYDFIGFKDLYIKAKIENNLFNGKKVIKVVQKTPNNIRLLLEDETIVKISKQDYKSHLANFIITEQLFYWEGYTNYRKGETVGAGRTYSKQILKKLDYELFPGVANKGLDAISWNRFTSIDSTKLITTLKQHNLFLCDIKDKDSLTKLKNFKNLQEVI